MQKWIADVIHDPKRKAIPIMTNPGIEILNYKIIDAVKDGKVHFEAIKALYERYPSSASCVIMDLTVEAEAFGAEIHFEENEVPSVIGRLVSDMESVKKLEIPDMAAGRIPQYLLANKLVAENLTNRPAFAGCIGPFSLAGRLYDMTEIMMACYVEPETAVLLLRKCTDFLINYCLELKKTGVQGVIMAEPAAGLMSNEGCSEFSSVFIKQIIDKVQDDEFIIILHNCGNTGHCTAAMVETGAPALHLGNKIDMVKALEDTPEGVLVMGNLDPVSCMKQGSPQEVEAQTKELLEKTKQYSNFVLSTGCDVPPGTSKENIEAFYKALEKYNSQN